MAVRTRPGYEAYVLDEPLPGAVDPQPVVGALEPGAPREPRTAAHDEALAQVGNVTIDLGATLDAVRAKHDEPQAPRSGPLPVGSLLAAPNYSAVMHMGMAVG